MGIQGLLQALAPVTRANVSLEEYRGKTLAIDGATMLYRAAYGIAEELALCSQKPPSKPSIPSETTSSFTPPTSTSLSSLTTWSSSSSSHTTTSSFASSIRIIGGRMSSREQGLPLPPTSPLAPPGPSTIPSRYWPDIERRIDALRHHGITPIFVLDGRRAPLKAGTDSQRSTARKASLVRGLAFRQRALALPPSVHCDAERAALLEQAKSHFQRALSLPHVLLHDCTLRLRAWGIPVLVAPYEADAQVAWLCRRGLA